MMARTRGVHPSTMAAGMTRSRTSLLPPTLRRGPTRGQGGAGQTDFAIVVAEAVKAAMVAVERSKRQGASASAMESMRADFEGDEEEEEERAERGGRARQPQRRDGRDEVNDGKRQR